MARIDTGDNLTVDILQPGWTTTSDGFGLITISATFKSDAASGSFAPFVRGTDFPVSAYGYCKSHKGSISWDALGIATLKVDYVGIDPSINAGAYTNANTSVANGLTAEHITAHPNFFVAADDYAGGALAGLPSDFSGAYNDSTLGPVVNRYNPSTKQTVAVPSCEGYYGACFEQPNGGRFIGFVDPDYPTVYGKTQYLATTTTISGVIYVQEQASVISLYDNLGKATGTSNFGTFPLIPDYCKVGEGTGDGSVNLLSQINVEEFGMIYKVIYEIRYSSVGWDPGVYINI
jgi:hypothetical protein